MQIRPATTDDIETVLAFWRAAAFEPSTTDDVEALIGLLDRDPGALLIADDGGRIAGTVIVTWDGWRGHLSRLAVLPGRRREGIARRLVETAEHHLRSLGARKVQAVVVEDNTEGRAFWDALGYAFDERTVRHTKTTDFP